MFDPFFIKQLKSPLQKLAWRIDAIGIRANQITFLGFVVGLMSLPALYYQAYGLALLCIVINRLMDGLDGAVARLQGPTDLGGYLDITLDFIFYSGVVFGFVLANPEANAVAAAFLIFAFMGTGSSFLAFAIMAEKRKIERLEYGNKSLYFLGGLTEGAETIVFLVLICLLPNYFVELAYVFGLMCWVTTVTRIYAAYKTLK
ncbi:CDP-alcohol phosphatidyltransferase family protein [Marinomonas posidonica]|uniref:CDP-alcohol phosphatidyltransferase n=1 Tax=Marinomonas posidonica (strain CECT 7376 / NCIMB 14433 / IVIA-Po-181) TaxID=491952 RepID=F6CU59_MARPP|nr:CDP-alcohol phosphatidyltransferase family protein [Marinomonas posidonica]AEF54111.1 CDP-alcohol phosphatidyltransferase [Marinomonas posidonica IVIA-Po-181]